MEQISLSEFSISSDVLVETEVFEAENCLVHTNFLQLNEEFGRHHLRDLYVATAKAIPEVRLHRLPSDVEVATQTDEDFIPYQGDRVVSEQVRPYWSPADLDAAVNAAVPAGSVSEEAILLARFGLRTWGHWLIELLPKAVCVEGTYPGRFRYVVPETLATDPHLRSMRQSLEAYGIARERLIFVRGDRKYRFAKLFAVSPIWFAGMPLHPKIGAAMRAIVPDRSRLNPVPPRIALLRRESMTRNLVNFEEISAYCEARGWSIVDVGDLDFVDQVRLFAGCKSVVSVLGSGLAGLIYAQPGIKVATLAPANWGDGFFYTLMQERRAALSDIRGLSVESDASKAAWAPFAVDIEELEIGLEALGLPTEPGQPPAGNHIGTGPNWPPVGFHQLFESAIRFLAAGKLDESEEQLRRAIAQAPGELIAQLHLVDLLMRQGKIAEAMDAAQQSLAVYASAQMLRLMQEHLTRLGRDTEAADLARRDVARDPQDAEATIRLGHALCRVEQFAEAADCFERGLRARPDDSALRAALNLTRAQLGSPPPPASVPDSAPAPPPAEAPSGSTRVEPRPSLWEAFLTHQGRGSLKWKQYLPAYQRHLEKFVDQSILLIEIGVSGGGSLQLWKKFLGPFVRIVGIDVSPACAGFAEDQIAVRIGDQKDPAFLQSLIDEFGEPDVVIDDGSHRCEDQIASFRFLYPRLSKNGVYVIEDLHAAYWQKQERQLEPLGNTIDLCKKLIDELHGRYIPGGRTGFTETTRSICFYDSMVVIERGIVQNLYSPRVGRDQTEPGLVIDQRGLRVLDPGEPVPQDT